MVQWEIGFDSEAGRGLVTWLAPSFLEEEMGRLFDGMVGELCQTERVHVSGFLVVPPLVEKGRRGDERYACKPNASASADRREDRVNE